MRAIRPLLGILCLLAAGCVAQSESRPIPPGVYYSEDSAEHMTVKDSAIIFHVYADLQQPDRYIDREYEYYVGYGFEIGISPLVSMDPMVGQDYRWFSHYRRIGRIDPKSGSVTWFSRPACSSWTNMSLDCLFPDSR